MFEDLKIDPLQAQPITLVEKVPLLSTAGDALLILAFPPGEGSITLLNVSLEPETN